MDVPHPCNLCQTSFLRSEQREMHIRERHGPPSKLGDRPHVKDRTIDGVRLPALLGKKKAPSPPPAVTSQSGEGKEKDDQEKEEEEDAAPPEGEGEEGETAGMLIVKEETDLSL